MLEKEHSLSVIDELLQSPTIEIEDPSVIRQRLTNLVNNAEEHHGSKIYRCSLSPVAGRLDGHVLESRDNGNTWNYTLRDVKAEPLIEVFGITKLAPYGQSRIIIRGKEDVTLLETGRLMPVMVMK